jgi:NitT/TauT family transport system substrate-binding protein
MIAVMLAVLAASSASALAQDAVSLRLNWYLGGLHVPFYYGKERGFYKEEGIDLTINEGRGSANTVQVVGGRLRHLRPGGLLQRDRHRGARAPR